VCNPTYPQRASNMRSPHSTHHSMTGAYELDTP
jgi:hypothetical protein